MIIGNLPAGPTDLIRQLVNLAVNSGRSLQSSQTGYIHYCYRQLDYPSHDTIPIYENFLFALALMRERTAESFAEGKALVEKLLHFQGSDGNFPIYLHEYPGCKDRNAAAHLLPIFYWILRTFPVVLGHELRDRFQGVTEKAMAYCIQLKEERVQFPVALKIACSLVALGVLLHKDEWQRLGNDWLTELLAQTFDEIFSGWLVPANLGDALISLQMVYPSIMGSPWEGLWQHLQETWHARTATYAGPGFHDHQVREQPEVTLLDLVMGFHSGEYSYRTLLNGAHLLQAALIHPTQDTVYKVALPARHQGKIAGRRWLLQQDRQWAWSALEKLKADPSKDNTYSGVRLLWGDLNCAHTLVCQGGNVEKVEFVSAENGVDVLLTLSEDVPTEVRQRNREVMCFLDSHDDVEFLVGQHAAATTFQLDEPIKVSSGSMHVGLRFHLDQGKGTFFGHIAKGNRPSQKHTAGDGRFKSYDWQLFLRTIDRDKVCRIKIEIRFVMGDNP